MSESARKKRRKRASGIILPGLIVVLIGGAIGAGVSPLGAPLSPVGSPVRSGGSPATGQRFAGHVAEPFVPCSSSVIDCFSKAQFGYGYGPGSRAGALANQSRGPRSRLIPRRAPSGAGGVAGSDIPLDETLSIPLAQLAGENAPLAGGAGGNNARAVPQFAPFPASAGPGGIGGEAALVPAPTPTPTPSPTTTPTDPIPAVPEPAIWLQLIFGFGIVGGILRRRRIRPAPATLR